MREPPEASAAAAEPHTHRCVHDELNRAAPTTVTPQLYTVPLSPLSPLGGGSGRRLALSHSYPVEGVHESARRPIRIHVDTSHIDADPGRACFSPHETVVTNDYGHTAECSWADMITEEKGRLLRTRVLPEAVRFLSELLSVHRVDGPLRLGSLACGYEGGVVVPSRLRDEGLPDTVRPLPNRLPARVRP